MGVVSPYQTAIYEKMDDFRHFSSDPIDKTVKVSDT